MAEVLLTIDTCSATGSVALSRGETLLGEVLTHLPGTHTDRLLGSVRQLLEVSGLQMTDIDGFGVVFGPGSFTGLRVGVATVKGLSMATGRPIVGVSSLRTLALQAPFPSVPVWALLDARKKEVYAGCYHWQEGLPTLVGAEMVLPPERLLEQLQGEVLLLGDGALVYRSLFAGRLGTRARFAPWALNFSRASSAAVLALADWRAGRALSPELLNPYYIRPSEAEIACRKQLPKPGF